MSRSSSVRRSHLVAIYMLGVGMAVMVLGLIVDARYPWLWAYLLDQVHPQDAQAAATGPTHILFTFVDHFEPHDQPTMDRWVADYPALAVRHHDADGKHPQHSWFWFFSQSGERQSLRFLQQLGRLSYEGFGEVELHLHHHADTEASFLAHITRMIQLSKWTGAMVSAEPHPRTVFGFIHGMWALDNSRDPKTGGDCGINDELIQLRRLGCYADFTHPSWGRMHPRIVNRLYYATDDPRKPKSYDTGTLMRVGSPATGDLLIFEGPSVVRFRGLRPAYDHGDVTMEERPTAQRIDDWIHAGIHVQGRPEWVFVKVFTHGAIAQDREAVLGQWAEQMYDDLERRYNDGQRYVLHYVTAREAYNIAKAAEAGKRGDPNSYRDFIVPHYASHLLTASVPYELVTVDANRLVARFLTLPGTPVSVQLRARDVRAIGDAADVISTSSPDDTRVTFVTSGEGLVELSFVPQPSAVSSSAPAPEQSHGA